MGAELSSACFMCFESDQGYNESHRYTRFEDLQLDKELGHGAFSTVRLAINRANKDKFAVKVIHKNKLKKADVDALHVEVGIISKLQHPHIVKYFDFTQDRSHYYIVLEVVAGGELFDRIVQRVYYSEKEARDLVWVLLDVLHHIHSKRIAHRDLKPENILVQGDLAHNNLIVKLCDFGLSLRPETKCADFVGSPGFFAPEILLEAVYDAFAADIWSYGALLIETVCGTQTFESLWLRAYRFLDRHDVFRELISECVQKLPSIHSLTRDTDLFRLVSGVLRINPEQRDTIATVVMNPWLYLVTESQEHPGQLEILRLTIIDHNDNNDNTNLIKQEEIQNHHPENGCKRRDALMSIALVQDRQPRRPDEDSSPHSSSTNNIWQRSRSMTMGIFSRKPIRTPQLQDDEYTLPPMTICHLDDSAVVRQVVQAKLSMAFPNHNLVNFADSTHLIHTIMASQERSSTTTKDTICICIFDENIGEDLKGSDLANMLKKLGYKGLLLCMTANEDIKQNDTHAIFDGVLSKQITTNKLKLQLIAAWKIRFGHSSLVPIVKLAPPSEDEDFHSLRMKCLEQMIRNPKPKLKRVELLEMKGDLESVRSSEGLLEQVRDLVHKTSADDYIPFTEDTPLYLAIKQELLAHNLTHREDQ
mmetsp:Transcript_9701/g.13469  ORF Transcript_9701/g.13469 Transcript_9701/m.13469 type:complete len:646 (+) Transcript_9701:83-2020(+)